MHHSKGRVSSLKSLNKGSQVKVTAQWITLYSWAFWENSGPFFQYEVLACRDSFDFDCVYFNSPSTNDEAEQITPLKTHLLRLQLILP